jgi:hypothetical protein
MIKLQNNRARNISKKICRNNQGDRKIYKEYYRDTPPPRRFRFQNQQPTDRPQEEEEFIRVPYFRISSTPRYQTIFFGLCYACNNFGHKTVNCRANNRKKNNFESHTEGVIQEGLVKQREEVTTCLNL